MAEYREAPANATARTPAYIRLAGLSSEPMIPTARFSQISRKAATMATPTAAR